MLGLVEGEEAVLKAIGRATPEESTINGR